MANPSDDSPPTAPVGPASGTFDAAPGTRIERYVVVGHAGQGGMGVVLLAYDPELDRRVALKLLRVSKLGADRERRLMREAQALARLSHPNVVPVYDVGTFEGRPFVAMEYVEGETLGAWLDAKPRSWLEIVAVLSEAGRGLAAAHRAGLVHRDIKPGNVLIGRDGRVRIVDFGLARSVEDLSGQTPPEHPMGEDTPSESGPHRRLTQLTRDDQVVGTPAYMSPEQQANGTCDARADQYSFGVTLFRALYRRFPREEKDTAAEATVDELGSRGRRQEPIKRGREVPAWLHKVVMRALSPEPAARYSSMDDLLAALARDPAQVRRRWAVAAALLAAGLVGTVGVVRWQRAERSLCGGGRARVAAVWSSDAAGQVRAAFVRSGVPWAPALADSLVRQLDDWAGRWATMHRDACEATHVRGEQSPEAMDLRMACLDDRLRELSAVTRALAGANEATVKRASEVAQSLTPLERCEDLATLHAITPPPKDAEQHRRVDELGQRVAEVEARYLVGRAKECIALGEPLVTEVHQVAYAPLEADAEHWLARCYSDLHDQNKAGSHFVVSFAAALAGHSDHVAAHVAARLAQEQLFDSNPTHLQSYDEWRRIAESVARRAGGDVGAELILARVRCISLFDTGQIVDRVQCMSDVVKRADEAQRVTEWDVSMLGLASVDAGRFDDGVRFLERGVRLSVEQLGDKHPRTLENRSFLCYAYDERGDTAKAQELCAGALRDARETNDRYLMTRLRLYLARAQRHLGRLADARATAEEALAAHEEDFAPDLELELGWLDVAARRTADAAEHMRRALAIDGKSLPPEHANVLRDRWALGSALLAAGDAAGARAALEPAVAATQKTQLSPLQSADLEFALARSLPPQERARAAELVAHAVAAYRLSAPPTSRHQEALAQMLTWR